MRRCKVDNCDRKHKANGFCGMHYMLDKRNGKPIRKRLYNNGRTKLPEYRIWFKIKERCYNKNCKSYKDYGGKGIIVCNRWLNNFDEFYKDMGKRPSSKHQIDRKESNGNYEPNNCRWVLQLVNLRNKNTTLTEIQIKQIRFHFAMNLMNIEISRMMSIDASIISNIKHGRSYKNYGLL